jgi:hypothetical protein
MTPVETLVTIVGGIVGAVSGAIAAWSSVLSYRDAHRTKLTPQTHERRLDESASRLAAAIKRQWSEEEHRRSVHDPFPMPVRWVNAREEFFDHWSNILLERSGAKSIPLDLSGDLEHVNDIFECVPSKRIVVLGRSGSGKTILALRYVLGALGRRKEDDPVPVVLGLASWNPTDVAFQDWLVQRIIEEYPGLGVSVRDGRSLAAALVDSEKIFPVLDGFDEIAGGLQPSAIIALNATTSKFLLTSRPAEYEAAVNAADVLNAAAGVTISELTIDDLAAYLPRTTRKGEGAPTRTKWDPVLAYLHDNPDTAVAEVIRDVLSTPLMVGLARAIYSDTKDRDPGELLQVGRFPTPQSLEDHLLDAFVPAVYHQQLPGQREATLRSYSVGDAQRWLEHVAADLDRLGSYDLAWWRVRDTISLPGRLVVASVLGVVGAGLLLGGAWRFGVGLGLGFGIGIAANRKGRQPTRAVPRVRGRERQLAATITGGVGGGLVGGAAGGLLLGLTGASQGLVLGLLAGDTQSRVSSTTGAAIFGLVAGLGMSTAPWLLPRASSQEAHPDRHLPEWAKKSLRAFAICFVAGIAGGVAFGSQGGLTLGVTCGIAAGLMIGLETPVDIRTVATPFTLLKIDRRNAIFDGILFGLTLGLTVLAASWPIIGPTKALTLGVGSGLMTALGACLGNYAWGHWITFTRIWLPLTGRAPFSIVAFIIDAHKRGVLRQAGPVYQFRHARLQDRLAERGTRLLK